MKIRPLAVLLGFAIPGFWWVLSSTVSLASTRESVRVQTITYHGWTNCFLIGNGVVEAVVVPAIGRVMQFRFAGADTGPFWENRAMDGQSVDPRSNDWGNFGGDKSWPAPQADWPKMTGRGWPPPMAFDSMPVAVTPVAGGVDMISAVDPHYGIRTTRRVRLRPKSATMRIETEYTRISGDEVHISVWVVTQLKDPVRVYSLAPVKSVFLNLFNNQGKAVPPSLNHTNRLISMERDKSSSYKIGTDAGTLLWIGDKEVLRMDSPRKLGRLYPDNGSSAEIYTNGDPNQYVELEMLGPIEKLKVGASIRREIAYTLLRRKHPDADAEAMEILKLQ